MFELYDNLPFLVYLTFVIIEFGCILNNQIEFHLSQSMKI